MQACGSAMLEPCSPHADTFSDQTEAWRLRIDRARPAADAASISGEHACRRGLEAHGDGRRNEAHMHTRKDAVFELVLNAIRASIPSKELDSHRRLQKFK
jgi:hypothetical protein